MTSLQELSQQINDTIKSLNELKRENATLKKYLTSAIIAANWKLPSKQFPKDIPLIVFKDERLSFLRDGDGNFEIFIERHPDDFEKIVSLEQLFDFDSKLFDCG